MYTKIGALGVGNYELDILGGHSYRVADNLYGVIGIGDSSKSTYDIQIKGNESRQVGGASRTSVVGDYTHISDASILIMGKINLVLSQTDTDGTLNIDALGDLNTRITGTVHETYSSTLTTAITGAVSETYSAGQTTTITGNQTTTTTGIINLN